MEAFSKFNQGVNKYLLAVIDIFFKYGWPIPLKDKTGIAVVSAVKCIIKEHRPDEIWVDKGKEFRNKDVKGLIDLYSTEKEEKSSVVDRWNRTMFPLYLLTHKSAITSWYSVLVRSIHI